MLVIECHRQGREVGKYWKVTSVHKNVNRKDAAASYYCPTWPRVRSPPGRRRRYVPSACTPPPRFKPDLWCRAKIQCKIIRAVATWIKIAGYDGPDMRLWGAKGSWSGRFSPANMSPRPQLFPSLTLSLPTDSDDTHTHIHTHSQASKTVLNGSTGGSRLKRDQVMRKQTKEHVTPHAETDELTATTSQIRSDKVQSWGCLVNQLNTDEKKWKKTVLSIYTSKKLCKVHKRYFVLMYPKHIFYLWVSYLSVRSRCIKLVPLEFPQSNENKHLFLQGISFWTQK